MGALDGRVAFVTGGARGQGRCDALTLAGQGADIAVCDAVADRSPAAPYELASTEELKETKRRVEELGRRCVATETDVREAASVRSSVEEVTGEFGRIDICIANAGIFSVGPFTQITDQQWNDVIATNLTGVFTTLRAVVPGMIANGGGRIVTISSVAGRRGTSHAAAYSASKWGVIGLTKSVAAEQAAAGITVNAICPTVVDTPMVDNPTAYRVFSGGQSESREETAKILESGSLQGIPWVESKDISNAVLFLVSDAARYINGEAISIDAGGSASNAA